MMIKSITCEVKSELKQRLNYRVNKIKSRAVYRDRKRPQSYHFEGSLYVNALAPGHSRVGEAVARTPPARHIHSLAPKVPEGLRNHEDGVVGQCWRVLRQRPKETPVTHHWHHADPTQHCTAITARLLSLQQYLVYTESSAADVKSKNIKASHYDWHKNYTSMKAASIQGQAGDKLFKQNLTEKIQIDICSLVSTELVPSNLEDDRGETKYVWRCWIKCKCSIGSYASLTFSGVFLASGNSLSSRRSQRWRNCWTMRLSGLMIWKPVMLAPPEKTLSRLMLEKPWEERAQVSGSGARDH